MSLCPPARLYRRSLATLRAPRERCRSSAQGRARRGATAPLPSQEGGEQSFKGSFSSASLVRSKRLAQPRPLPTRDSSPHLRNLLFLQQSIILTTIYYSYNNLLFLQQSIILTTIYNSGETVIRLAPSCFELLDYLALLNSNQNPNCALGRQTSKEMQLAPNRLPKTSMASPDHQSRSARMASLVIYLRTTFIHDSWRTLKNQLKNLEKQEKTIKNLERLTKKPRNYKQQGY
jgi:hypothetical protein